MHKPMGYRYEKKFRCTTRDVIFLTIFGSTKSHRSEKENVPAKKEATSIAARVQPGAGRSG